MRPRWGGNSFAFKTLDGPAGTIARLFTFRFKPLLGVSSSRKISSRHVGERERLCIAVHCAPIPLAPRSSWDHRAKHARLIMIFRLSGAAWKAAAVRYWVACLLVAKSSDVRDKELAAVGARSGIGHGKRAGSVGQVLFAFISKVIARTTAAGACGIASLDHEVGNYPMEDNAIVEAIFGKENKIIHRFGCVGCIEFADNIAA